MQLRMPDAKDHLSDAREKRSRQMSAAEAEMGTCSGTAHQTLPRRGSKPCHEARQGITRSDGFGKADTLIPVFSLLTVKIS